jgi:hypothetical protein
MKRTTKAAKNTVISAKFDGFLDSETSRDYSASESIYDLLDLAHDLQESYMTYRNNGRRGIEEGWEIGDE